MLTGDSTAAAGYAHDKVGFSSCKKVGLDDNGGYCFT